LSLQKAFYAVFRYCKKKGFPSCKLAKEIGVSRPTACLFHCKIQQAFASSGQNHLKREVHMDEFVTAGHEEGKPERFNGQNKRRLSWRI
jgi:hypothetical protein